MTMRGNSLPKLKTGNRGVSSVTPGGGIGQVFYTTAVTDAGEAISPMFTGNGAAYIVFAEIDNGYTRITNTLNKVFWTPAQYK